MTAPGPISLGAIGLRSAFKLLHMVADDKTTIPVLRCVHLVANPAGLSLRATDLDMVLRADIDVEPDPSWSARANLPIRQVSVLVRGTPQTVSLDLSQSGHVWIAGDDGVKARIRLLCPADDWPSRNGFKPEASFTLSEAALWRLLRRSAPCISTEETRYYLNGAYLHVADAEGRQVLRCVTTDGHRLARVDADLPEGAGAMPGVIVPAKAVRALIAICSPGGNRDAKITMNEHRLSVQVGGYHLDTKLIDGTFPNYTRVIPERSDRPDAPGATVTRTAIRRLAAVKAERSTCAHFDPSGQAVTIRGMGGEFEVSAPCTIRGSTSFGINVQLLLEAFQDEDVLRLSAKDETSPFIVDGTDPDVLQVIMPMRV